MSLSRGIISRNSEPRSSIVFLSLFFAKSRSVFAFFSRNDRRDSFGITFLSESMFSERFAHHTCRSRKFLRPGNISFILSETICSSFESNIYSMSVAIPTSSLGLESGLISPERILFKVSI